MSKSKQTPSRAAAVIATVSIGAVLFCMAALTAINIPTDNKDLFNMGFGAIIGWGGAGVHFFLGSSKGSKDKTAAMAAEMAQDEN